MILIFGSEGLMGSEIVKSCTDEELEFKVFNHTDADITDYERIRELFEKYKPDKIINCVGIVGVSVCDENKELAIQVNSDAVLNLAILCHKYDVDFIQLSTMGVFSYAYFSNENETPYPDTLYTATKLLAEKHIINNCQRYHIVRLPFIFGKIYDGGTLNNLLLSIKENKEVTADMNAWFRFGYNKDMAEQVVGIMMSYPYGIYHVYNSEYSSMYGFLSYAKKKMGSKSKINRRKKEKDSWIVTDNTKYKKENRTWREAIIDSYE